METLIRKKDWLTPVAFILFLLAAVLMPFAAKYTYAGRSEAPDHILTYTDRRLVWDSATQVDETGSAQLNVFHSAYQNVRAENEDKLVAPGTENTNIVRLKNDAERSVSYIAVLYRIKAEDDLPVEPVLANSDAFTAAQTYPLPDGVSAEQVITAVTGTLGSQAVQDFDITWTWPYDEGEERDKTDTELGNRAAWFVPDDVTTGLYIVVEEEPGEAYTVPTLPQTGDPGGFTLYAILAVVSGAVLVLRLAERRKERSCTES